MSWKRDKLSKIKNDKNHYLKIDIPKNKKVYTIFVKSQHEINDYEKYITALKITKPSKSKHKAPEIKYATLHYHYVSKFEMYKPSFETYRPSRETYVLKLET